ncbi:glycosyltransferase [Mariniflexile maritimum]|uniref:glycosyltransferase n=1 Tax=Mariniflexile maritimum TaxID=2682493 RepID=UPI0012F63296|nr:glycosyltransferase [Mariniflexile maritimum]
MNVLQLIDSLNAGGAERVAVNYANALVSHIKTSHLCATREEGVLKDSLSKNVSYLFLNKQSTFDLKAIKTLHAFIKNNKIDLIHAHGSSFFIATLVKILTPKLKLIWHEHYGNREQTSTTAKFILKICSYFFSGILVVNAALKVRCETKLFTKKVYVLPNYPHLDPSLKFTTLLGKTGKRMVCLANLRPDKDHLNLLEAFKAVHKFHADWTLHLVGHYDEDVYYHGIKNFIESNHLENHVFFYGSCVDTFNILNQSTLGVLASKSEGLPLALLEYGLAKLPVVATNVGDCNKVISNANEGLLISAENPKVLAEALITYMNDLDLRAQVAENLNLKVLSTFSEAHAVKTLLNIYNLQKK